MGGTPEIGKGKKTLKLNFSVLEELGKYNAIQQGKVQYTLDRCHSLTPDSN